MSSQQPVVHLLNTASFFAVLHNAVQNGALVGYTAFPADKYDPTRAPPLIVDDAPVGIGADQCVWLKVEGNDIKIPTIDVLYQEIRVTQGECLYRYSCDFNAVVQELDKEEWDRLNTELMSIEKGSQTGFVALLTKFNQQLTFTLKEKDEADRKRFDVGHAERETLMNALVGHQISSENHFQKVDGFMADMVAKMTEMYHLLGAVHRRGAECREAARAEHRDCLSRFAPLSASLQRVEGQLLTNGVTREASPSVVPVVVGTNGLLSAASLSREAVGANVRREASLCSLPSQNAEHIDASLSDISIRSVVVASYVGRKVSVLLSSHAREVVDSIINESSGQKDSVLRLLPCFHFPGSYTRKGEKNGRQSWDMFVVAVDYLWESWLRMCRDAVGEAKELMKTLKERKIGLELDEALLLQNAKRGTILSANETFRLALLRGLTRGSNADGAFEYRFLRIASAVHKDATVAEFNALIGGGAGTLSTPGERSEADMSIFPRGN